MSARTTQLIEQFESLPLAKKELFTVELIAHVKAQGLSAPLNVEQELRSQAIPSRSALSPAERAEAFRTWAESHPRTTPVLSDDAISRETIYSHRG